MPPNMITACVRIGTIVADIVPEELSYMDSAKALDEDPNLTLPVVDAWEAFVPSREPVQCTVIETCEL